MRDITHNDIRVKRDRLLKTLTPAKPKMDVAMSKYIAHEAIAAEHARDFVTASLKWLEALAICRNEKEEWCRNRAETCRKLALEQASKVTAARIMDSFLGKQNAKF